MTLSDSASKNLSKKNIRCCYAESKTHIAPIISQLISKGDTFSVSSPACISRCEISKLIKSNEYHYLDRYNPCLSIARQNEIYIDSFKADVHISDCCILTEKGELCCTAYSPYNSAMLVYGPKSVIVVVGFDKIVRDLGSQKGKGWCNILQSIGYRQLHGQHMAHEICLHNAFENRIKVILVGENLY